MTVPELLQQLEPEKLLQAARAYLDQARRVSGNRISEVDPVARQGGGRLDLVLVSRSQVPTDKDFTLLVAGDVEGEALSGAVISEHVDVVVEIVGNEIPRTAAEHDGGAVAADARCAR